MTDWTVYLYSAGESVFSLRIVSSFVTSSLSLRLAGSQLRVGESQAPRYLSGLCGDVTDDGCTDVVPSGWRTVMGADV